MRVAIYARVSTKDKGQDTENQLVQLRKYATVREWTIREYVDHDTGKHAKRAQLTELFAAASRREFDVVLVWALDRFTREGVAETFMHIKRLLDYGVQFESFSEAHFRTTGGAGELMIAIAAWIAKQERIRISERTRAGLEIARAKGRFGGRRERVFNRDLAVKMRSAGCSWREIAKQVGVPFATVRAHVMGVQQSVSA